MGKPQMLRIVFYALLILFVVDVHAAEQKKPTLEWCLDELPPRHYFVDGVPQGPMVAMMKKLAERADFELTFSQPTPTSRCLLKMKNGQTDLMTGLLFTSERAAFMKLWPFDEARPAAAFIHKNSMDKLGTDWLNGQTLVLAQDRVYPEQLVKQFKQQAQVVYAEDIEAGLAMLLYGDADILFGPQHITEFAIKKNKRYKDLLVLSPNQLPTSANIVNHMGISRKSKHIDLAPKIAIALQSLIAEHKTHFYQGAPINISTSVDTQ